MRDRCAKIDIKLKHNSMNIIVYRMRNNKSVASPEPAARVGDEV
jgi:hypothetical protein